MLTKKISQLVIATTLLASSTQLLALPFSGSDITIYDGDSSNNNAWYGTQEDQEVEPGMVRSQQWDLEGFWAQNNGKLAIVSGFDQKNGVAGYRGEGNQKDFRAGDIFIDVDGDHHPGNLAANDGDGQSIVNSTFGYDFVLDIDWINQTFDVVNLATQGAKTSIAWYDQNFGSSPWKYEGGGYLLASGLSFSYLANQSDANSGNYLGGNHYIAYDFDFSAIGNHDELWFHNTMGCGNDNLMGHIASVPEPSSIALLVIGLLGLGFARKKA